MDAGSEWCGTRTNKITCSVRGITVSCNGNNVGVAFGFIVQAEISADTRVAFGDGQTIQHLERLVVGCEIAEYLTRAVLPFVFIGFRVKSVRYVIVAVTVS